MDSENTLKSRGFSREDLEQQLADAGSMSELARRWGVRPGTARYRLSRFGIVPPRTGFKSPGAGSRKHGPDHHNWKGGVLLRTDGYLYQYAPDHPAAASAKGYVLQHRLVMEAQLGRLLAEHEIVHHKNEDKQDNRPENLELTTRTPHMKGHKAVAPRDAKGQFI